MPIGYCEYKNVAERFMLVCNTGRDTEVSSIIAESIAKEMKDPHFR